MRRGRPRTAVPTLAAFYARAPWCKLTTRETAEATELTPAQVSVARRQLEDVGLISLVRVRAAEGEGGSAKVWVESHLYGQSRRQKPHVLKIEGRFPPNCSPSYLHFENATNRVYNTRSITGDHKTRDRKTQGETSDVLENQEGSMRINSPFEEMPEGLAPKLPDVMKPHELFLMNFSVVHKTKRDRPYVPVGEDFRHAKNIARAYGDTPQLLEQMMKNFFATGMYASRGLSGSPLRAFWNFRVELEENAREILRDGSREKEWWESMTLEERECHKEAVRRARSEVDEPPLRGKLRSL